MADELARVATIGRAVAAAMPAIHDADLCDVQRRQVVQRAAPWLADVLADLFADPAADPVTGYAPMAPAVAVVVSAGQATVAERVFDILCERRFSHLSRTQARRYRAATLAHLQADAAQQQPLRFFYDLGGGYHAGLRADFADLRFVPGLGELLALRQIRGFAHAVAAVYPPGVRFHLVIDDRCAAVANGIGQAQTAGYVARLRALLEALRMNAVVTLLVESETVPADVYQAAFDACPSPAPAADEPSPATLENIRRFLGRACSPAQALAHLARYQRAQSVSERLLALRLNGVRLTQRATPNSLGFRAFPGGDSRLQSGEVVVLASARAGPRPLLVTSRNRAACALWPLAAAELPPAWPLALGPVFAALPLDEAGASA
jgi:hypothetical protein